MSRWILIAVFGTTALGAWPAHAKDADTDAAVEAEVDQISSQPDEGIAAGMFTDGLHDAAFEGFTDIHLVRPALVNQDAAQLTDIALQAAEAERVLMRKHRSGIAAEELLGRAILLAAETQDQQTLDRLRAAITNLKNESLAKQLAAAERTAAATRADGAEFKVSLEGVDLDTAIQIKGILESIELAEAVGDALLLSDIEAALAEPGDLKEEHVAALKKRIGAARESAPNSESPLNKLVASTRGWNPRETIGQLADGDIVGAISGADFRIPITTNSTVFRGSSGRNWIMVYRLKNQTSKPVRIQFSSGNRTIIQPGKSITCRSRASSWGNENTGIKYTYPKVKATTPDGANWLRTISRDGEDYFIIRRGKGIQIVP